MSKSTLNRLVKSELVRVVHGSGFGAERDEQAVPVITFQQIEPICPQVFTRLFVGQREHAPLV